MQFQAKLYPADNSPAGCVVFTAPADTAEKATEYLDHHVSMGRYTGGHVEEYVIGIGWVVRE